MFDHWCKASEEWVAMRATRRVAKLVLVGVVPPIMVKTPVNPP